MHKLKKQLSLLILIGCICGNGYGQSIPDSVIRQYNSAKTGKEKFQPLFIYVNKLRGDSLFFEKASVVIDYLKSVDDEENQDRLQLAINDELSKIGDYTKALASCLEILNRFEQQNNKRGLLLAYRVLSTAYFYAGDKEKDIIYGKKAFLVAKEINEATALSGIANNLSTYYSQKKMPDSALLYARLAIVYAKQSTDANDVGGVLGTLSEAFISAKQYDSALVYVRKSLDNLSGEDDLVTMAWTMNDISQIFLEKNQFDSSKYYAQKAIAISSAKGYKDQTQRAYEYLSRLFDKTHQPDSAFNYLTLAVAIKDSLYTSDKSKQLQEILAREQTRQQEREKEQMAFKNKIRIYGLVAGLAILSIIAFFLLRNNRQKQKANKVLQETLTNLKSTQAQLIQSEKMASLGELTAGIAHEIQNPLNFVNNFSEVNTELADELKSELAIGNTQSAIEIAVNIKDNEQKINHHGKRADAIVKGMLQHSRASSGQKELTDINALADEYLRLAYHGLRAKDKSFNAKFETSFDNSIGKVNIVPQEIGRVILNLINNAFYAASLSAAGGFSESDSSRTPTVWLNTRKDGNKVLICVKDNGPGIPSNIIDKIFHPFFTTKPTGEGTGLGLSLSYDIITKGHGGEIKVESKEQEGATFIITIPVNQ